MKAILFCDLEINTRSEKIEELGFVYKNRELKTTQVQESTEFILSCDTTFIAGHNFIDFDKKYLEQTSLYKTIKNYFFIDTLPVSLLLFNEKTHHSLPKNYKSEDDFKNNPVEDAKITEKLFIKLYEKFMNLDEVMQSIFISLLADNEYFFGFFKYVELNNSIKKLDEKTLFDVIIKEYTPRIVHQKYLQELIVHHPVELAYILALLTPHIEIKAHPPKILYTFTNIIAMQKKLCFSVESANKHLLEFSKDIFGFNAFREFQRLHAGLFESKKISQQEIVEASLRDEDFLAILPTGGGKTFTFWLPAVYKADCYKSLTVVISPLQALIEDHIKSFNAKVANFKAVAISGFLSPLERSEAIEAVINGDADILYIAPESLRSETIFRILKNRLIERFVIDEVHCLSTWGNDFRQDYYYICEYIKELEEAKGFQKNIPISCFTATAKPSVIEDIERFFYEGLGKELDEYFAVPERKNLTYTAIEAQSKDKYTQLLKILNTHQGATLVYIPSSTKECDKVAEQLSLDTEKSVKSFHSKLDSQEKMAILTDYIQGKIDVIVATTAFGMGVDKSDIMNVIHYEVSDSLESYAQEAGRGARDEKLQAFCPILFDEDDLDKHFNTLNRSKITANEINSILRVIKKSKDKLVTKTAFELAKDAGWDIEDNSFDYATKVKTILLELEREGYITRKRNKTSFFADSIVAQSMQTLHQKLQETNYTEEEKQKLVLVLQSIVGRGKVEAVQIDELAYVLGLHKHDIALCINQLKEIEILGNAKDLSLEMSRLSISQFEKIAAIEQALLEYLLALHTKQVSMRELNDYLVKNHKSKNNNVALIKTILKGWRDKSNVIFKRTSREHDIWHFQYNDTQKLVENITHKHTIARKLLQILVKQIQTTTNTKETIEFSLKDLREQLNKEATIKEIDKALLYLHHLGVLELLNGRFISYSPMNIYKEEKTSGNKRYTLAEYKKRLDKHYQTKIESIHIMGEYAKRLERDGYKAVRFLKDYFTLPYEKFKKEYKLLKKHLSQPLTQKRFHQLFDSMNEVQKEIIEDSKTQAMMILAGPGSGKTKVLVHKIASLILREDIKPSQFMMLTFSKSAKLEFKSRLQTLLGTLAYDIEVQTFHSYALELVARVVEHENDATLEGIIQEAREQIQEGIVQPKYRTVLVLDEFQDVNEDSFALIEALYNASNKELRIIAVGDDDQCIMEHIGSKVTYIERFEKVFGRDEDGKNSYKMYELLENFRSGSDIVNYTNSFVQMIEQRYKQNELFAHSTKKGSVFISSYPNTQSLVPPLVKHLQKRKSDESVAVLTYTNEEVMQIYSLLLENKIEAKYIIEKEKFHLKNVIEIKEFCYVLDSYLLSETTYKEEYFHKALGVMKQRYKNSSTLTLLQKIVDRFLGEHDVYYISQWDAYIYDSKVEDFENYTKSVVVSTIHKSKGMEFDSVYLLVNENPKNDTQKRLYYVGMTRAKSTLHLLVKGLRVPQNKEFVHYNVDEEVYTLENKIFTYEMSLADIQLGFDVDFSSQKKEFFASQHPQIIRHPKFHNHCLSVDNKIIATFSKKFEELIVKKFQEGYRVEDVTIQYVVVWYDDEKSKNLRHPLCKIVLKK